MVEQNATGPACLMQGEITEPSSEKTCGEGGCQQEATVPRVNSFVKIQSQA